jgi:hypothetical protein
MHIPAVTFIVALLDCSREKAREICHALCAPPAAVSVSPPSADLLQAAPQPHLASIDKLRIAATRKDVEAFILALEARLPPPLLSRLRTKTQTQKFQKFISDPAAMIARQRSCRAV